MFGQLSTRKCFVHDEIPGASKENVSDVYEENSIILTKENVHHRVCHNLRAKYEYDGKYFCLLHYPGNTDEICRKEFKKEFQKRIADRRYDFRGVHFPITVQLSGKTFKNELNFAHATFTRDFICKSSHFEQDVIFDSAIFDSKIEFDSSTFDKNCKIFFQRALIKKCLSFKSAEINGYLYFEGGNPRHLVEDEKPKHIFEYLRRKYGGKAKKLKHIFEGEESMLDLRHARIDKPEHIFFHCVRLQPNWFVNVDCRKFVFINCRFRKYDKKYGEGYFNTGSELDIIKARQKDDNQIHDANALLRRTCTELADNHEENKSFIKASQFRFMSNECERLSRYRGFKIWSLHWWYWLVSFYGESWQMALAVLVTLLWFSISFYMLTNFRVCPSDLPFTFSIQQGFCDAPRPLYFGEAVAHSLATATFQTIEYQKPSTIWGEIVRNLERMFVPLQAALLAFAIRRRFMR